MAIPGACFRTSIQRRKPPVNMVRSSENRPRFTRIDTSLEGDLMGGFLQLLVAKIGSQFELWSRVNGGGEEEEDTSTREREEGKSVCRGG